MQPKPQKLFLEVYSICGTKLLGRAPVLSEASNNRVTEIAVVYNYTFDGCISSLRTSMRNGNLRLFKLVGSADNQEMLGYVKEISKHGMTVTFQLEIMSR